MDIENRSRYEAAIERNIRANANKTRSRNWYAANPDAGRIHDFLHENGEFEPVCKTCNKPWNGHMIETRKADEYGDGAEYNLPGEKCKYSTNSVVYFAGDLRGKMRDALSEWGSLTEKQTELVRNMIKRGEEKVASAAQRRAEKLAADSATKHVGTVGERRVFDLTIERVLSFDSQFGTTYINLCRDADGNVVVYKGSNDLSRGEYEKVSTVRVKATVKAHELRDGIPQTIIARPKEVAA